MKQQPRVIGELTLIACGNHLRASAALYGQSKIGSSSWIEQLLPAVFIYFGGWLYYILIRIIGIQSKC